MAEILILGLFAMSFNLLYGYMGQISFGHAAFFGVGAYASAMVFTRLKTEGGSIAMVDFFVSLLAGPPQDSRCATRQGFASAPSSSATARRMSAYESVPAR